MLYTQGNTQVLCNATVEPGVPRWMQSQNISGGWITAEYSMLPRSTLTRTPRENNGLTGRTQEIRRLIGRSLRSAVDLSRLGSYTITIDCDVIQADGGTRTASITGGYLALAKAISRLVEAQKISPDIILTQIAAVSIGIVNNIPMLDLCYEEDSNAEVDFNVVMNGYNQFIEVQGTAEKKPFSRQTFDQLIDIASSGIKELFEVQKTYMPRNLQFR